MFGSFVYREETPEAFYGTGWDRADEVIVGHSLFVGRGYLAGDLNGGFKVKVSVHGCVGVKTDELREFTAKWVCGRESE